MKLNDKAINFRIKPYIQEAVLQFILDVVVIVIITVVFIIVKFPAIACIVVDIVYLILALNLHYRVAIQAIIDKQKYDYISETISIKQFNEEYSFAGDRLGHSHISFFYPKEKQIGKYKIKAINDKGEEKKLRSVMSFRRLHKFSVFDKYEIEYLNITYLKSSGIIVSFDLVEDIDKIASKRKIEEIKKAMNYINMSI